MFTLLVVGLFPFAPSALEITAARSGVKEPYWQKLTNLIDIQYFGDVQVGSETMSALFDTGSFELLVFGEGCKTCGKAVAYHHSRSPTYIAGNSTETHSFGSGTCYSNEAYERVVIGPFVDDRQPFWEVVQAHMPVLEQASFQSIVGVGPPGEPAITAKAQLEVVEKAAEEYKSSHGSVPPETVQQIEELKGKVASESGKLSLLEKLGVTTFSSCLGRGGGSAGWLVWNDLDPRTRLEKFVELPVAGKLTWSIQITGMALETDAGGRGTSLGCEKGCGAIVDTGTSLLSVPSHIYRKIYDVLAKMDGDCSDLRKLPDLVIKVGEHQLRFPADNYVGMVVGQVPNYLEKHMHSSMDLPYGSSAPLGEVGAVRLRANRSTADARLQRQSCQLLLMDMGEEQTQLGPLAILGMPFFREYYTTFGLAGKRTIHVAKADDQCRPSPAEISMRAKRALVPKRVDATKLRGPTHVLRTGGPLEI